MFNAEQKSNIGVIKFKALISSQTKIAGTVGYPGLQTLISVI